MTSKMSSFLSITKVARFVVGKLFLPDQLNYVASQRVQRVFQIYSIYHKSSSTKNIVKSLINTLKSRITIKELYMKFGSNLHYASYRRWPMSRWTMLTRMWFIRSPTDDCRRKFLLSLLPAFTFWDREGIDDQEIKATIEEFWKIKSSNKNGGNKKGNNVTSDGKSLYDATKNGGEADKADTSNGLNSRLHEKNGQGMKVPTTTSKTINNGESVHEVQGTDFDQGWNQEQEEWEAIIIKPNYQVWRRLIPNNSSVYQYKIFGSYDDIPATCFFSVQMDLDYRKTWDKLVVKLDIVDQETSKNRTKSRNIDHSHDRMNTRNKTIGNRSKSRKSSMRRTEYKLGDEEFDSGNQVIHWIMHYPFPMYQRDYCYIRRGIVDRSNQLMVLVSRSVSHPKCCEQSDPRKSVRVDTYESKMVIRANNNAKSLSSPGFDYLLTYYDDPRAAIPSPAYNWMAKAGAPDFADKLHSAALVLYHEDKEKRKKAKKTTKKDRKKDEKSENVTPGSDCKESVGESSAENNSESSSSQIPVGSRTKRSGPSKQGTSTPSGTTSNVPTSSTSSNSSSYNTMDHGSSGYSFWSFFKRN